MVRKQQVVLSDNISVLLVDMPLSIVKQETDNAAFCFLDFSKLIHANAGISRSIRTQFLLLLSLPMCYLLKLN